MKTIVVHQGINQACVSANGDRVRIIKNGQKWPGSFAAVESLVFSPQADLFACVIESPSQGKNCNLINAERPRIFWDGVHCIYREGVRIGHANFSQKPTFYGGHYLWIRSRDRYQSISYSDIMCNEECAAISGRGMDEPQRLTLKGNILEVNGVDGIYDGEKSKHVPFSAVIEYQLSLSPSGLSLQEVSDSYCAWSD